MVKLGFTYYDDVPVVVQPTIAEMVASLSTEQKVAILDGFTNKALPKTICYKVGIPRDVVLHLYRAIDAIEERARALMREEVIVTPAELDEFGIEVTPAEFNTPPDTSVALLSTLQADFADDFTSAQVSAILTRMVKYSKHDGSGTWTFYKNNVTL